METRKLRDFSFVLNKVSGERIVDKNNNSTVTLNENKTKYYGTECDTISLMTILSIMDKERNRNDPYVNYDAILNDENIKEIEKAYDKMNRRRNKKE